uniref:Chromo domain-containing protein n=1 Tax=Leptobrachium leishanense TaxID=445787 RepID=A0A8C5WKW7_9ANUR
MVYLLKLSQIELHNLYPSFGGVFVKVWELSCLFPPPITHKLMGHLKEAIKGSNNISVVLYLSSKIHGPIIYHGLNMLETILTIKRPAILLSLQYMATSNLPALENHLHTLQQTWVKIKDISERNVENQKGKADRSRRMSPVYKVGDQVWLSTRHIRLQVPTMKLAPCFIGPYRVLHRINPVSYELALPQALRIHNVFHVSLLKPLLCNRFTRSNVPPPPVEVEGEEEYEIKAVLDSRLCKGSIQYMIDWKGYGPEDRSWLPARDVMLLGWSMLFIGLILRHRVVVREPPVERGVLLRTALWSSGARQHRPRWLGAECRGESGRSRETPGAEPGMITRTRRVYARMWFHIP